MLAHRHPRTGNRPKVFQGRSSRIYDLAARTVLRHLYRRLARDVATAAPSGAAVLDIGTGPGVLLVELARLRPDLTLAGLDLSADMVSAARRNLARHGDRATVEVGDVAALPYEDGSVAAVVSTMSQHHWPDRAAGFRELRRVLRPGGRVLVYDLRPLLRLAGGPARAAFEGRPVRSEPVRTSRLPVRVFARLSATG